MRASLLGLGFIGLTQLSARWRPLLWRWLYDRLARKDEHGDLLFMNYGYADDGAPPPLAAQDQPFRYPIQLYMHVVEGMTLTGKDVLEVGSGRGGGGSFLTRHWQPHSYTGVDLSVDAIAWCRRHHPLPHARWVQGRADAIPADDDSIDVVVNVESSHCYPSMTDFVNEVKRVLRPGGYFALCDLRGSDGLRELEHCLSNCGLSLVRRRDITANVVQAMNHLSQGRERLAKRAPRFLHAAMRDFVGLQGSALYNGLAGGELRYVSYQLQK